jgi:hypothetical protein
MVALVWSAAAAATVCAVETPWADLRATQLRLREARRERAVAQGALTALGEHTDWGGNKAVLQARARLAECEAAYRSLVAKGDLAVLEKQRDEADRKCREVIEREVIGDEAAYAALLADLERARRERDELHARKDLSGDDAKRLARLRIRVAELDRVRDSQLKALWLHNAAANVFKDCAWRRSQWQEAHAKGQPAGEAQAALDAAGTDLAAVYQAELAGTAAGKLLLAERDGLDREITELTARMEGLVRAKGGDKSLWKHHEVQFELPPDKEGKSAGAAKVGFWHLPEVRVIRGLIVRGLDHPMILMAAADCDLAFVWVNAPRGVDIRSGNPSCFELALARAAEASGHPEVAHLPFLTKGTSAGVLFARNMGFWKPERCIGVVHHAGGNLHHARGSPPTQMPHVPFLAINGEFERYGPEGSGHASGIYGIRGEYGKQTQWVMCREQLLRMRRQDPDHLISLVVQPRGDHAAWDEDLWWITAMFVRKAARARIPALDGPPTQEVRCVPLKASDGWLSDARLDHPRHPPAAHADYRGDKVEAFWHLDKEMAQTVAAYHDGEFYLPDLSLKHPVPADWGVVK